MAIEVEGVVFLVGLAAAGSVVVVVAGPMATDRSKRQIEVATVETAFVEPKRTVRTVAFGDADPTNDGDSRCVQVYATSETQFFVGQAGGTARDGAFNGIFYAPHDGDSATGSNTAVDRYGLSSALGACNRYATPPDILYRHRRRRRNRGGQRRRHRAVLGGDTGDRRPATSSTTRACVAIGQGRSGWAPRHVRNLPSSTSPSVTSR